MTRRFFVVIVVLLLSATTVFNQSKPSATVQGVWRVAEVVTTGPGASTNSKPQPGLYIFTAKHYSIVKVDADNPRPNEPQDVAKASASELIAAWNPFTGQTGTYELDGGNLTVRPLAAKNPTVMASGSFTTYSYKLDGDTLMLIPKANKAGPVANQVNAISASIKAKTDFFKWQIFEALVRAGSTDKALIAARRAEVARMYADIQKLRVIEPHTVEIIPAVDIPPAK